MLSPAKSSLRTKLKHIRLQIPVEERRRNNGIIREKLLALEEIRQAGTIFCFLSMQDEVDTHTLIEDLRRQGKTIVLPKILPGKKMEVVSMGPRQDLVPGEMGILVPRSSQPFTSSIDICLTPGLGFSAQGNRLGFGRGYYDKWLSTHEVVCKIGLAYDCQVLDEIPVDEFDVPMDMIVTEKQIYITNS